MRHSAQSRHNARARVIANNPWILRWLGRLYRPTNAPRNAETREWDNVYYKRLVKNFQREGRSDALPYTMVKTIQKLRDASANARAILRARANGSVYKINVPPARNIKMVKSPNGKPILVYFPNN